MIAPTTVGKIKEKIPEVLDVYGVDDAVAIKIFNSHLAEHFVQLRPEIVVFIETDYVDKVFRNSYYKYFSSKLRDINRNCIKLSFFEPPVEEADFRSLQKSKTLQGKYLGFMILRPTLPRVVGRSVISPEALIENDIYTCLVKTTSTAMSVKLRSVGFPHSSQDAETIRCAEATIWAMMEYLGNKYPEYSSVLPEAIIEKLKHVSSERQLPALGLKMGQISYVLREMGLGVKTYSRADSGDIEFENRLSCYVESGFPIIVSIDNSDKTNVEPIGHAALCIGRKKVQVGAMKNCPGYYEIRDEEQKRKRRFLTKIISPRPHLFDYDDLEKEFVFIDDNKPVYQKNFLKSPCANYKNQTNAVSWQACQITGFIVPLHNKVNLDASLAKEISLSIMKNYNGLGEVVTRTYLTSSRTYKQYVTTHDEMSETLKDFILETPMPKFVWVTEISTIALMSQSSPQARNLIILDSTEPDIFNFDILLFALMNGYMLKFNKRTGSFKKIPLSSPPFKIFEDNLEHIS